MIQILKPFFGIFLSVEGLRECPLKPTSFLAFYTPSQFHLAKETCTLAKFLKVNLPTGIKSLIEKFSIENFLSSQMTLFASLRLWVIESIGLKMVHQ